MSSSNVFIFLEFTNSFAVFGPIPYMFAKMFIGLSFSFSNASSVPVAKNSSYFCRIVFPIPGKFNSFNSFEELISLLLFKAKYLLSSFIAFI